MPTREQLAAERALCDADDQFWSKHPHDEATGRRLAVQFTERVIALFARHVRDWGKDWDNREPVPDNTDLPSLAEVDAFLTDEQRQRLNEANAALFKLQTERYGEDPVWRTLGRDDNENDERE